MKVTADHWVNVNGTWYRAGETYDDGNPESAESTPAPAPEAEPENEQPKRRKRTTAKES